MNEKKLPEWMLRNSVPIKKARPDYDPGRLFKRILHKAFKAEGVAININDIHDVLLWAMGEDYPCLAYQKWGDRIMSRHPELRVPENIKNEIPVYIIMRGVARLYKETHRQFRGVDVAGSKVVN